MANSESIIEHARAAFHKATKDEEDSRLRSIEDRCHQAFNAIRARAQEYAAEIAITDLKCVGNELAPYSTYKVDVKLYDGVVLRFQTEFVIVGVAPEPDDVGVWLLVVGKADRRLYSPVGLGDALEHLDMEKLRRLRRASSR